MHAEVLTVGSELLSGQTINTNAAFLAQRLRDAGVSCLRHVSVPDDATAIVGAVADAVYRAPLLVITGGLGPTDDDLTMPAVAEATSRPLAWSGLAERRVRTFYRQHHRRISRLALRQAYVPQGASILPNPIGTAPGIWLPFNESVIVALPGVPQEMRAIMDASVLPRLRAGHDRGALATRVIRVAGVVELEIQQALQTVRLPSNVQIGFYPHLGTVDVSLVASGTRQTALRRMLSRLERDIRQRLGAAVYGRDRDTLEAVVGRALMKRRWTVAVAESCTGGLISDRLTDVPGSSRYVVLSVVAYHNAVKQRLLGVEPERLARHGAVSRQTAAAMARGVRQRAGADVGLAITGIAGPSGATAAKPVGLVYLGLAIQSRTRTARLLFHGDRRSIKEQACQAALDWLRRSVRPPPD